ncbi:MAG: diaminopimelate decarboxylase [Proteobacteria bacterium]|nr:diaminopimelate decarboxylase [Pseudomonadota bacterium]
MHHFQYRDGLLHAEDVPLTRLAEEVGTPLYVYSAATLKRHYLAFDGAFPDLDHLVCYSVKANSNLAVLNLLASLGAGMDIVSGGELHRALSAGADPSRSVFSGVGKQRWEISMALEAGILMFNVESSQELDLLSDTALNLQQQAPVAIRVNPDVDPKTHPYISTGLRKNKFGLPMAAARDEYLRAADLPGLRIRGVSCHIGSQLTQVSPFVDALRRLLDLVDGLRGEGLTIDYLDLGGGLGIVYNQEEPPHPVEYGRVISQEVKDAGLTLILEPGRVIAGNAGILLTRVIYTKRGEVKDFVVVDGAMNDLIRPSLYSAYHEIRPVIETAGASSPKDVVGPICETGDFLAQDRPLTELRPGDLLAVMSAGAYCFVMASNYNSRGRPAEVLVCGDDYHVVRTRERTIDLIRGESVPAEFIARAIS